MIGLRNAAKPYILVLLAIGLFIPASAQLYTNRNAPVEERVNDLLSNLTLEEKVDLCHGSFASGGIPRLGIARLRMLDGRQGLRPVDEKKGTRTTLLPCVLGLSCTWDIAAAERFGKVLAEEMLALDQHVLLAPMLNLVRSPLGGRNFENFGEDPFLVGRMGAAYIRGVQDHGVGACACLLVANDCEFRRHFTSSNMDERTLRELHILGYEMSIREGKVWGMMTGNNLYNGVYCAQNHYLIQDLVKNQFGFDGVMITDWRAAYDTVPAALAGTDMTTGFCSYVFGGGRLLRAVQQGEVPEAVLDEKVRRILRLYVRSGVLDPSTRLKGGLDTPEHRKAAREIAAQSIVLLKNEGRLLPIDPEKVRTILITGPAADNVLMGGGSGSVPAAVQVSPLQGLKNAFGTRVQITHIAFPAPLRPGMDAGSIEWEQSKKGKRKKKNAQQPIPAPDEKALAEAAAKADVVVFMAAGFVASEGRDLPSLELPGKQAEAISALNKTCSNVVVALAANGAVNTGPWMQDARALLALHYAGQATGDALADILVGKENPSAKLTYTFSSRLGDYAPHALGQWPARLILEKDPVNPGMTPETRKSTHAFTTEYKEGVFAGYRWFDKKKLEPTFPFGFGLSYTTFELSDLKINDTGSKVAISCTVKNTGKTTGAEVVQVYVTPAKASAARPPRELKGFARTELRPGEARAAEIALEPAAFAFYDTATAAWKIEPGTYGIEVGTSSRDIRLRSKLRR